MPTNNTTWWSDERVDETVTAAYIHSHLRANEQQILKRPLYFGGDLTDNTYLDWILGRAKRLFLILVSTGIPDQIFGVVDDSFDDDDLPISQEAVPDLRLSFEPDKVLDTKFYKTQFRFLTRILEDGEHIRYAEEETVPITSFGFKSVLSLSRDGVDTVKLPSDHSRVLIRKRISLADPRVTEESMLAEIASMKAFSHEHVVSVFASYLQGNTFSILSLPAAQYTLKSFLMDTPKVFEALPKTQRRQTLMNWPHCLANALSWLHANGGHHGAIRPSAIGIDQNYSISLGPLDGDGFLCDSSKPDDIESYQYAPPERWKRAVTVQSTGSGKVALPSGGRSARKANEPPDPADPSTRKRSGSSSGFNSMEGLNSYAFLPASKSEYTRFRLSAAITSGPVVVTPPRRRRNVAPGTTSSNSRSTTRATNDRGSLARAPSALSQNSSEGQRKSQKPQGIFVAARESRTAVVQTWRSVQHDSFAADVFSLGAVIMDILTVLCKRTYSSFARHRSAKNRNAGRGGGLADASFHANIGQVMLWAQTLSEDAEKKVKKDESQVLQAVGAVIQVTVQCLERNPEARLKSFALEQRLRDHIKGFANMNPHCFPRVSEKTPVLAPREAHLEEPPPLLSPINIRSDRSASRSRQATIEEEPPSVPSTTYSPSTRPTTSRTMVGHQSPPSLSLASMPSFNMDMDGGSDTVVGGYEHYRESRHRNRSRQREHHFPRHQQPREIQAWTVPEANTPKKSDRWEYIHGNESQVDPQLTLSTNGSEQGGVFTYINYSTSPSEDGEEGTTYHYPLPPAKPPPTRNLPLPPAPSISHAPRPRRAPEPAPRHRYVKSPPPQPSREEVAMLRQLSQTSIGGHHPPRMSSLNRTQSEEDEEEHYREKAQSGRKPLAPAPLKVKGERRERVYRARV